MRTRRHGIYYLMWSEGGWGGPTYSVAYGMAKSPLGPFKRIDKILQQNPEVGIGAGHPSLIHVPGTDRWYIVYHRRPLGETDANHRVVSIDCMRFDADGRVKPMVITRTGVAADPLRAAGSADVDAGGATRAAPLGGASGLSRSTGVLA